MRYVLSGVLALFLCGGCTVSDRREILESAAIVIESKAVAEVTKELVKEGIEPAQARKVAEIAVRKIDELVRKLIEEGR